MPSNAGAVDTCNFVRVLCEFPVAQMVLPLGHCPIQTGRPPHHTKFSICGAARKTVEEGEISEDKGSLPGRFFYKRKF